MLRKGTAVNLRPVVDSCFFMIIIANGREMYVSLSKRGNSGIISTFVLSVAQHVWDAGTPTIFT